MGKMKENPRYNIVCTRIEDQLLASLTAARGKLSVGDYLREAIEEKIIHDQQQAMDDYLRMVA